MRRDSRCNRRTRGNDRKESPSAAASRRSTDPLVLFLVLGAGVFALDLWPARGGNESHVIEVTADEVDRLHARWTAQWGRPPTGPELESLIAEAVDEEILYREAQRLGLDVEDAIVRRRLAQKMTFVLEDAGGPAPAADEVERYYARHAERYRRPRRTTFDHVFLSADRRTDPAGDAAALLREVAATDGGDGWKGLGDPFMLARSFAERTDDEIARLFGPGFEAEVSTLPAGSWRGPIESTYGVHLVRVRGRTASRTPGLGELRDRVVADLQDERRRERGRAAYRALRDGYDVRLPTADRAESAQDR